MEEGVCRTPPPSPPIYGQPAVGTHPTGMNFCLFIGLQMTDEELDLRIMALEGIFNRNFRQSF